MNPLTNMKNQQKMNERELALGLTGTSSSWHSQYDDSAWIYVGGLPYELTEGDVLCIFSQYGEIVNINLVRDKDTGKSKGFAFICYEDQRSTILAVDNLNGAKVLNRAIRVDHKHNYQVPKERADEDDLTKLLREKGCAPETVHVHGNSKELSEHDSGKIKKKKKKKEKKKKDKKTRHAEPSPDTTVPRDDSKLSVSRDRPEADHRFDQAIKRERRSSSVEEDETGKKRIKTEPMNSLATDRENRNPERSDSDVSRRYVKQELTESGVSRNRTSDDRQQKVDRLLQQDDRRSSGDDSRRSRDEISDRRRLKDGADSRLGRNDQNDRRHAEAVDRRQGRDFTADRKYSRDEVESRRENSHEGDARRREQKEKGEGHQNQYVYDKRANERSTCDSKSRNHAFETRDRRELHPKPDGKRDTPPRDRRYRHDSSSDGDEIRLSHKDKKSHDRYRKRSRSRDRY